MNTKLRLFDTREIEKTLRLFCRGRQTHVRILNAMQGGDKYEKTFGGWFGENDGLLLARQLVQFAEFKGAYFVFNEISKDFVSNGAKIRKCKDSVSDNEIARRVFLMIDLDCNRPADTSATDEEHERAISFSRELRAKLSDRGWPLPILADSGNGGHLYYAIDVPADDEQLIQKALIALDQEFSTDEIKVDTSVFNPSRITKLYGTLVCKGEDTDERPWRMSKIIESPAPDDIEILPTELIQDLASAVKEIPRGISSKGKGNPDRKLPPFNPDQFIKRNGLDVRKEKPWDQGGRLWEFENSPMCEHEPGKAWMAQHNSGAMDAGCQHESCKWGWNELRDKFGHNEPSLPPVETTPGQRVMCGDRSNIGTIVADKGKFADVHFISPDGTEATKTIPKSQLRDIESGRKLDGQRSKIAIRNVDQFDRSFPTISPPIIEGVIRRGEVATLISGAKQRKTWTFMGMAMSMAAGIPWMGISAERKLKILYVDPEMQPETFGERRRIIAGGYGLEISEFKDNFFVASLRNEVDKSYPAAIDAILEFAENDFDLIFIDSIYRMWPDGDNENDVDAWNRLNNALVRLANELNCGIWVSHHSTKGEQSTKRVTDVGSGSGGLSRTSDAHLVMREHKQGDGDMAVIEGAFRSFKESLPPITIKFEDGVWVEKAGIPPELADNSPESRKKNSQLKNEAKEKRIDEKKLKQQSERTAIVTAIMKAEEQDVGATMNQLRIALQEHHQWKSRPNKAQIEKILNPLIDSYQITQVNAGEDVYYKVAEMLESDEF